jgi:hypothetical protein
VVALLDMQAHSEDIPDQSQELAMKTREALDLAIESMTYRTIELEHLVRDWLKYGDKLAFRKEECRQAAVLFDKLNEAIAVLKAERNTD